MAVTTVLAINPGSSSVKAAVRSPDLVLSMTIDRIGTSDAELTVNLDGDSTRVPFNGDVTPVDVIAAELAARDLRPEAVGHRVVHGGPNHWQPTVIDDDLLADLREAVPLAPLHLPGDLDSIVQSRHAWPDVQHIACFDTGFHHDLPEVSRRLPVPPEVVELGVRRYGFHGLSLQSVLAARPDLGQTVIAHLGSGCSVTSVVDGKPRHTTMSLTPTSGMISATRAGDLDPEIVLYLIEEHGWTVARLREVFDHRSGIAGLADGRHDLRDLLAADDESAALAVAVFVADAAMAIASCATTLDRWDSLVFTGGVGQHSVAVRARICARLLALRGVEATHDADPIETLTGTGVQTLVVPADEQAVIDRLTRGLLLAPGPR